MRLEHFDSLRQYRDFALAKGFYTGEGTFNYAKNGMEKLGSLMIAPVHRPMDSALRNIRNPLMILSLTVAAIAAVTILFYPVQFLKVVGKVAPIILELTPAQAKFSLYALSQITILGLGLRTLGRLCNNQLMAQWDRGNIHPIPIGAIAR